MDLPDLLSQSLILCLLDLVILPVLVYATRKTPASALNWPVAIASALFWELLSLLLVILLWDLEHKYIYPARARWLVPFNLVVYGGLGWGLWWLAQRLPGVAQVWFAFLGGVEGLVEHLVGIYRLGILDKVPLLQGVSPLSVLVFSYFEYMLYWTIVIWLALGLFQGWRAIRKLPGVKPTNSVTSGGDLG